MDRHGRLKAIAAGVLCAALAGCAAWGGEQTLTRKDLGYQISFPDTFTFDVKLIPLACAAVRQQDPWVHIDIANLKEGDGLSSFFKIPGSRDCFRGTLTDIRIVKLDGRNALKITTKNGAAQYVVYYCVGGTRGYSINFWGANVDKYAKDIDAIVKSFKLLKTE